MRISRLLYIENDFLKLPLTLICEHIQQYSVSALPDNHATAEPQYIEISAVDTVPALDKGGFLPCDGVPWSSQR